jgi:hypothetical protein
MFRRSIVAGLTFVALTASAWAASPAGIFKVTGTNPGSATPYAGAVMVTPTGSTFKVEWRIAGQSIIGTGLWVDEKFVVGYPGNSVAVYTDQGGNVWQGHWANGASTEVGTERWTK